MLTVRCCQVGEADVAKYKLRVVNEHGDAECDADLTYDCKYKLQFTSLSANVENICAVKFCCLSRSVHQE